MRIATRVLTTSTLKKQDWAEGKNNIYDRFRERIIFPIRNRRGSVIGFGGRSIGEQQPKYLNSPETQLFQRAMNYTDYLKP